MEYQKLMEALGFEPDELEEDKPESNTLRWHSQTGVLHATWDPKMPNIVQLHTVTMDEEGGIKDISRTDEMTVRSFVDRYIF
jgi:hypothetical protein